MEKSMEKEKKKQNEATMDETKLSKSRLEVLSRIREYERDGRFDEDVESDPPTVELTPDKVDYLREKNRSKLCRRIANFVADKYYLRLMRKGLLVVEGVTGKEALCALANGAVITCNHFSPLDNYALFHAIREGLPKKYLYKVIREGNYTNFPGLYGFFFRHCDTLPLSANRHTMMKFLSAANTLLKRGESILIYPEQGMWWNYKKPRPFKLGAFKIAYRAGVPVLPTFITMRDDSRLDGDGYPVQRMTVHLLQPIYPNREKGEKVATQEMRDAAFAQCKAKYEETYRIPLRYAEEENAAVVGGGLH